MISGDATLADELVQDTILKALEAQDQFRPGSNLRTWLFTILRNQYLSLLRRKRTRDEVGCDDPEQLGSVPAFQESGLEVLVFRNAFAALSAAHRTVLILVRVEGLSYDEVARITGCELGTVKSRICRARRELQRAFLDEELPGDAPTPKRGMTRSSLIQISA